MQPPARLTDEQWFQVLERLAWVLARIVVGYARPGDPESSWGVARYRSRPTTGTWARKLCNRSYQAYDEVAAAHGEAAAAARIAGDAATDAAFDRLDHEAQMLLSPTLMYDAQLQWQLMRPDWRAEWVALALQPPRGRRRRWSAGATAPAPVMQPTIGMPDIGKPPMVGRVEGGVYVLEPRELGPFQPGSVP
jgi:hypothetical protein